MKINAGAGDCDITAFNTTGSLTATLGHGDDIISLEKTIGFALITSRDGSHDCTFDETAGVIDISFGDGISHSLT